MRSHRQSKQTAGSASYSIRFTNSLDKNTCTVLDSTTPQVCFKRAVEAQLAVLMANDCVCGSLSGRANETAERGTSMEAKQGVKVPVYSKNV